MDWQKASKEGLLAAEGFAFSGRWKMDVRLAYRTLGISSPGGDNAVLGNGLECTHSSGVPQDAAEDLHGLATGADVYREIEHGIDRVVQLPDSVLVYGWQRMIVKSGGTLRKLDNLSLAVLSRKEGGWKLFAYVSTPLPIPMRRMEHR